MADHVEDVQERLSALETRVDDEVTAVQQHFAELQRFITFSLDRRLGPVEDRLTEVENRLGRVEYRLDTMDHRFDGIDLRFDRLETKLDAYQRANQGVFKEILTQLPALEASQAAMQKTLGEILSRLPKSE